MFFMGTPGKQTNKKQCILHTLYIEKKLKKTLRHSDIQLCKLKSL